MPQIGPLEILVIAAIALIVFGPQKLPEIARSVGKAAAELRRMTTEIRDEFETGLDADDDEPEGDHEPEGDDEPEKSERGVRRGSETGRASPRPEIEDPDEAGELGRRIERN